MKRLKHKELSANTVAFISYRRRRKLLAESSLYFIFHQALSAPAMSTDVSQVGVALIYLTFCIITHLMKLFCHTISVHDLLLYTIKM